MPREDERASASHLMRVRQRDSLVFKNLLRPYAILQIAGAVERSS